ncbi:NAD(P)H-binding protein [bacterium]|nr:NAD(P)H-binding protein [bacterium]
MTTPLHVVTGAFGYSGRRIARVLLERGSRVRTLTNSPNRHNPFGDRVEVHPFNFENIAALRKSLEGAAVLYNTYWVRFNHGDFTHAQAVKNTRALFAAAREAGVERVVHVSITNPSLRSGLEYFRGKAELEKALEDSGISHAILRPAVLFGGEDILINNIAWALRQLPIFGVFGDGQYKIQPIHVEDFARLAVELGEARDSRVVNAIGPETFTFRGLVEAIAKIINVRRPIISVPPVIGWLATSALGLVLRDVMLTRAEIEGLMQGLLAVDTPPTGTIKLTEWAREHANELGRYYASELARRRNRNKSYQEI